jgi:glycosyltransferase involved in cell wall biosynthesis
MATTPLVSVLIPMYNGADGVAATLESIQQQSYSHWEVILVDDGSTDGSAQLAAASMPSAHIISQPKGGIVQALNLGLKNGSGEFIARLDCNDECAPDRFERQLQALKDNPSWGVVGGHVMLFDESGDIGVSRYSTDPTEINLELHRGHSAIAHPAMMARRSLIEQIGPYDASYEGVEDFELLTRASLVAELGNVDAVVIRMQSVSKGLTYSGVHLKPLIELALIERRLRKDKGLSWKSEVLRAKYADLVKTGQAQLDPHRMKSRFFAMRAGLLLRSGERKAANRDYLRSLEARPTNLRSLLGLTLSVLVPMPIYQWMLRIIRHWGFLRWHNRIEGLANSANS